ncbi:hypothetical protein A3B36_02070 [Candidatus Uhrbacteria bacterium RIFCSPLOWO2_01_FULL_55_36]|uniref:Uncharacterized protein n=1 Tax=Candidatus Uhrbacteria bacterium RIFCSPLOWO2_01_FULL_55_36 TaxID=1802404 RepID=A0A1F7V1U0_9BACT|nr:MAG: hypothetical protein A3B36_02070 [Candidatus Uhrbacteria bacterium RIFCSPLOWO2_01_FULL_55_36]
MTTPQDKHSSAMESDIEIPLKTHREYIKFHDKVDTGGLDAAAVVEEGKLLFSSDASVENKKRSNYSGCFE